MLGKLLEGAAWCATLTLATAGTLTFVPDGAWETFPSALRPVRAKLADIGVAPTRYRVGNESETAETEKDRSVVRREGETGGRNDWDGVATRVRVGERWRNVERIAETSAETEVDARENGAAFAGVGGRNGAKKGGESANDFGGEIDANGGSGDVANDFGGGEPGVGGYPEADAIPPFVETGNGWGNEPVSEGGAASPNETGAPAAASLTGFENLNAETDFPLVENALPGGVAAAGVAGTAETAEVATIAGVAEIAAESENASTGSVVDDFNAWNDLNATLASNGNVAPLSPLEGAADPLNSLNSTNSIASTNSTGLANSVNPANSANSPVDETAELRSALAAASTASTPEDVKTVFETLNRIRDERGARLAAEDAKTLDAALDRLAFEVFYNPAQAILEPRWTTTAGETLATIAERTATTPETLAAINGLSLPNDAPLPVGTTLKTVRGPASAEISIAKKELTLRFNGLYAGRFALGVPASSANLRGDFRVVEKLANPNCDAVDANARTISIPGGAPENPLGAAWIALDGGVGLQGTNRPELVGQLVPENGGFVFSDREISQLSVLLPIGAVVSIVD